MSDRANLEFVLEGVYQWIVSYKLFIKSHGKLPNLWKRLIIQNEKIYHSVPADVIDC